MIIPILLIYRIIPLIILLLFINYNNLSTNTTTVTTNTEVDRKQILMTYIVSDLQKLNAPEQQIPELSNAIYIAQESTGIDPKLIIALMKKESNFKTKAIGPHNKTKKRYKGLMQTPTATYEFSDVDTLHGARILEQKLKISKNDLRKALALYKGGTNKTAYNQADNVLKIYSQLL